MVGAPLLQTPSTIRNASKRVPAIFVFVVDGGTQEREEGADGRTRIIGARTEFGPPTKRPFAVFAQSEGRKGRESGAKPDASPSRWLKCPRKE